MEQVEPRITIHPARCGHHYDKACRSCRDAWEWTDGEMERLQATRTNDQAKDEEIARLEALVESAFLEGFANYAPARLANHAWEESDTRHELKGGK